VSSVVRALRILDLLAQSTDPVPLAEVCRRLEIPKSTAHNILRDLVAEGFAEVHQGVAYTVGIRAFEVGSGHLRVRGVQGAVTGELVRLSRSLEVTSHFAVLDGADVVYLAKEDPPGLGIRLASSVGARLPAHTTAVGKANLAWLGDAQVRSQLAAATRKAAIQAVLDELAQVRQRGYATDDGATAPGVMCVAAPAFGPNGPTGAVGVSYVRGSAERLDEVVAQVTESAKRMSAMFGGGSSVV
jgi:DNA-binding IclR family transcriptional regulator